MKNLNKEVKKHYLVYQITNKIDNMIYIGVHATNKINDSYMGSGANIRKAIKQYGLENFEKVILYKFDNQQDMLNKERELVNEEFISNETTYNLIVGGGHFLTIDNATVIDKDGNIFNVNIADPRYISGELVGHTVGKIVVRDKDGNIYQIDQNDKRYLSGELYGVSKGRVVVRDKYGKMFYVNKNDERYLSGEYKFIWKNKKHKEETKKKIGEINKVKQKGELNSNYGKCWITMKTDEKNINRTIKKEELNNYLSLGWKKGRKI